MTKAGFPSQISSLLYKFYKVIKRYKLRFYGIYEKRKFLSCTLKIHTQSYLYNQKLWTSGAKKAVCIYDQFF